MAMMRSELRTESLCAHNIKVVLVGESGVGKTSISIRFAEDRFTGQHQATIGAAFVNKKLWLKDQLVKLHLWDTGGQERFHSMAPLYYRGAHVAIIVYDVTQQESFNRVQNWINEIRIHTRVCPLMILVGNKVDMSEERQVSCAAGNHLADSNSISFIESSAKDSTNIDALFKLAAQMSLGDWKYFQSVSFRDSVLLDEADSDSKQRQSTKGCRHCH